MKVLAAARAAQLTLSKEVGYVRKPHGDRLRVALAFPEHLLRRDVEPRLPDRVPALQRAARHRLRARVPAAEAGAGRAARVADARLVTLESQTPVRDFDVLAFSVSFEWDYTNVLTMLRLAGMPLRAAERDHRHPLVVIGGAVTFVNPEPLALFADVIAAGEGEVARAGRWSTPVGSDRRGASCCGGSPRSAASTSRRSTTSSTAPTAPSPRYVPREGTGAPPTVRKAALQDHRRRRSAGDAASSRPTPSSARASSSRSCAAAPTCAASAGPATTTCRCARFPTDRILAAGAATPVQHATQVGLVSIALCDHPDIEHILAQPAGHGLFDQPGVAAPRRPDADDRAAAARERRAHAHDRAGNRLGSPAPRHQQDGDQRRDPRPRPS